MLGLTVIYTLIMVGIWYLYHLKNKEDKRDIGQVLRILGYYSDTLDISVRPDSIHIRLPEQIHRVTKVNRQLLNEYGAINKGDYWEYSC